MDLSSVTCTLTPWTRPHYVILDTSGDASRANQNVWPPVTEIKLVDIQLKCYLIIITEKSNPGLVARELT